MSGEGPFEVDTEGARAHKGGGARSALRGRQS